MIQYFRFNPNCCEITKSLHKYARYDNNLLKWALNKAQEEDIYVNKLTKVSVKTVKKYIDMKDNKSE